MSDTTLLDLDSLLDGTLDSVEDLPDYVTPPTGLYVLTLPECKLETFTKRGKDGAKDEPNQVRIRLTYKVEGVLETEEGTYPPADGSLFSDTFMFNDMGKAIFKKTAKAILDLDSVDGSPFRELFDALIATEPFEASIVTKQNGQYENTKVTPRHPDA